VRGFVQESLGSVSLVAVLGIVAIHEVVEITAIYWILISTAALPLRADAPPVYLAAARFFEREMLVGTQVVNPERFRRIARARLPFCR